MIFNQVFIQPRAERLNELIEENEIQKKMILQKKKALPPLADSMHSKSVSELKVRKDPTAEAYEQTKQLLDNRQKQIRE